MPKQNLIESLVATQHVDSIPTVSIERTKMKNLYACLVSKSRSYGYGNGETVTSLTVGLAENEAEAIGSSIILSNEKYPSDKGWKICADPSADKISDAMIINAYKQLKGNGLIPQE